MWPSVAEFVLTVDGMLAMQSSMTGWCMEAFFYYNYDNKDNDDGVELLNADTLILYICFFLSINSNCLLL